MELSAAANWNQTAEDWCRIMQLSPNGCRCIKDAEKVVATTTLLPYDKQLAWIGMVLTRPEYRRQGLAKRLMKYAIATAEQLGIGTLKLDATDQGRPLYESLGFTAETTIERWGRDGSGLHPATTIQNHPRNAQLSPALISLDAKAFGVERSAMLETLSRFGMCDASASGYVLSRPGRSARYLGPCVANSGAEAERLIIAHLESPDIQQENWYWDMLSTNQEAISCAEKLGFTRRRLLLRMRRGEMIQNNDAMVYAIAGFELG
jgi:RimJ/RimL family protein N-acetyltransferase